MATNTTSYTSSSLPMSRSHRASTTRRRRRPRHANLLAVLTPALLFTLAQVTQLSRLSIHPEPDHLIAPSKRYAVVNFVDKKTKSLWGIYSIHKQMLKFHMLPSIRHVALVASDMKKKDKKLLEEWLGQDNVIQVNEGIIRNQVPDGVWGQVFSKLEFFNLTQFDKVIGLDNDIFIRQNIAHWFDYPAPAATQARGTIEWNSGAMVIEPNTEMYEKLLEYIPKTRRFKPPDDKGIDTWNSGQGHQGFLSAFFSSNVTSDTIFTMNYGSSVLSSDLMEQRPNAYFWRYRRSSIETVHLTHKPWKSEAAPKGKDACEMYREWLETVADAPRERLYPLHNFLRRCGAFDGPVVGLELLPPVNETKKEVDTSDDGGQKEARRVPVAF